jgi:hypothetical protein
VNQNMMPLESEDTLNFMMCVETPGEGLGIETLRPEGRPAIPSIIVSMLKIKDVPQGQWLTTGKGTGRMWHEVQP